MDFNIICISMKGVNQINFSHIYSRWVVIFLMMNDDKYLTIAVIANMKIPKSKLPHVNYVSQWISRQNKGISVYIYCTTQVIDLSQHSLAIQSWSYDSIIRCMMKICHWPTHLDSVHLCRKKRILRNGSVDLVQMSFDIFNTV